MGPEHDGAINTGGDGAVLSQGGSESFGEVWASERYVTGAITIVMRCVHAIVCVSHVDTSHRPVSGAIAACEDQRISLPAAELRCKRERGVAGWLSKIGALFRYGMKLFAVCSYVSALSVSIEDCPQNHDGERRDANEPIDYICYRWLFLPYLSLALGLSNLFTGPINNIVS